MAVGEPVMGGGAALIARPVARVWPYLPDEWLGQAGHKGGFVPSCLMAGREERDGEHRPTVWRDLGLKTRYIWPRPIDRLSRKPAARNKEL